MSKEKSKEEMQKEVNENERGHETTNLRNQPQGYGDRLSLGFGLMHASDED